MATLAELRARFPQYNDMTDQQFADGFYKKYYSDIPREEFDAKLGIKAPEAPKADPAQDATEGFSTLHDSATGIGQGITFGYGDEINAGLAAPFRAGADWMKGNGFDLGKAYDTELTNQRNILHGSKERSPIAETVGEIGGAMATVPRAVGGAAVNATYPAMIGRGAATGAASGAAYGFGTGEGGLENRAENAGVGAAVGGVTGGLMGALGARQAYRAARQGGQHTSQELYNLSDEAYDALDALGPYDQAATNGLVERMRQAARAGRVGTERNRAVWNTIDDMEREFAAQGATPRTLEEWRRVINQDLVSDRQQRRAGMVIRGALDDFLQSGEGGEPAQRARAFFRRAIQLQRVEDAVADAERVAARSSRDEGLHIKNRIGALLRADERAINRGRPAQFDPDMREQMRTIAETGRLEGFMRWVGKMSPDSGLGALTHSLLGIGTGGASLAYQIPLGATSFAAKQTASGATRRNVEALMQLIHGHENTNPQISAQARRLLEALTRGTVAATQ